MSFGVVMMVHTALDRAAQVARHWARHGCPVVIHVDRSVPDRQMAGLTAALSDIDTIRFCDRHRCEWGTWSLVQAAQSGAELLLECAPDIGHVLLASGSCVPLRPVGEMAAFLAARPETDFIESVTTRDVSWTIGGLDEERFRLWFPFSWKRHRRLFDASVALQRRLKVRRSPPVGLVPHLGSQWWCLTRATLKKILNGPDRAAYDNYFRNVWIPDESYFQTLARRFAVEIESRSLTLSKFDIQGRPHLFYDDHLQYLRRSDCFVARKIWPKADGLYRSFLSDTPNPASRATPNPAKIDRIFAEAVERRTRGRPGLYMQSRFPNPGWENGRTAAPYSVLQGFDVLFHDFEEWLTQTTGACVHGRLYGPERAAFAGGDAHFVGAISDSALIRDYNPCGFLSSLIWNTRGEHQGFQFGPEDNQEISWFLAGDPNAHITVISGAWAVPLFRAERDFSAIRESAARLQQIEAEHLDILSSVHSKAQVRIWSLAQFIDAPMEPLQHVIDPIGTRQAPHLTEAPRLVNLAGFGAFLQRLKNEGMQPHLVGDYPLDDAAEGGEATRQRPYLVN